MSTRVERVRAIVDHVEKHGLEDAFNDIDVTFESEARVNIDWREDNQLSKVLRWSESFEAVEIEARRNKEGDYHLHAVGSIRGGPKVDAWLIAKGAENDQVATVLEGAKKSPLPMPVLAELVSDAAKSETTALTTEQLAEVEHWSKTPLPDEVVEAEIFPCDDPMGCVPECTNWPTCSKQVRTTS